MNWEVGASWERAGVRWSELGAGSELEQAGRWEQAGSELE